MNVSTKLLVQISAHSAQFVAGINQANKHLGFFQKSLVSLKNTLLGTFGAYAFINEIGKAITTLAEFDKTMTAVGVITGSNKDQFNDLENAARSLGSTTQYTAKQVAELQLEFGRLGFSTGEIISSTRATVDLATATGEGLARSAEIAGSTLRAFQLDATKMGMVTDIMAASLNSSALTLDTFADGIKYVSPVAKATGVTLAETAAMMSVLADAGIKGSQAGTSLRRIFTMLTKDGKSLSERLKDLSEKGITLADANDEVGLYAQTALLHLSAMLPRVDELTKAFNNSEGATREMARAMEDNLATALQKMGTAYDSWILSLKNSEGVLRTHAKHITNLFTIMSMNSDEQSKLGIGWYEAMFGGMLSTVSIQTAEEYADKLRKLREEAVKLIEVQQRTPGFFEVDPISGMPLDSKGQEDAAKGVAKTKADILAIQHQQLKAQEEYNKEYQKTIKLVNERYEAENRRELERINVKEFLATAGDRSNKLRESKGGSYISDDVKSFLEGIRGEQIDSFSKKIDYLTQSMKNNKEATTQMWMGYAMMADKIGDSISRVITGELEFGDAIKVVTSDILDQVQKRVLAYMIEGNAKLFAQNPILGIAAIIGTAAAFGTVRGLLNQSARSGSSSRVRGGNRTEVYGRFEMSGRTAVALVRAGNRSNSITGG